MPREGASLPDNLFEILHQGIAALLLTVDETGFAHTAFTYAATTEPTCVAVLVDDGSRTLANIERTGQASVQILAPDNVVYLLKGTARVSNTRMTSAPVPARRANIELVSAKNQAWGEVAVSPLAYDYSSRAQAHWEGAIPRIFAELRGDATT